MHFAGSILTFVDVSVGKGPNTIAFYIIILELPNQRLLDLAEKGVFFLYSWNAKFLGANLPVSSGALSDIDLFERIDEGLLQILDSHQPEPLNEYVAAKITDIQVSFRDTHS